MGMASGPLIGGKGLDRPITAEPSDAGVFLADKGIVNDLFATRLHNCGRTLEHSRTVGGQHRCPFELGLGCGSVCLLQLTLICRADLDQRLTRVWVNILQL